MAEYTVTYDHGGVAEVAQGVGASATQLYEIHNDILQQTNAIADFFEGEAATAFRDSQMQMLKGLEGLIETMANHGRTITSTNESAGYTDKMMATGFNL